MYLTMLCRFAEDAVNTELNTDHIRAIVYYNWKRGLNAEECKLEMDDVLGDQAPLQTTISNWYRDFAYNRTPRR
jgi:hypothetical protein